MIKHLSFKNPAFLLFILILTSCSSLKIPAPDLPPKTLIEPPIEKSVITIPVTVSLDLMLGNLGLSSSNDGKAGSMLAGKLRRLLNRQASRNEKVLLNNQIVRGFAGKAWDALQRPIPLDESLSLLINPEEISLSSLPSEDDTIKFILGLVAEPKIIPDWWPSPQPLPAISLSPAPPQTGFHINLAVELPFDLLSVELTKKFEGRAYTGHGESVIIEKMKVYGSGESVVIAVTIKGSVKGTVYLSGIPEYDALTNVLSLRNLDYTLQTRQVLAKAAEWFMHSELQESLARRASWDFTGRIEDEKNMLSNALNRTLTKDVRMTGKIKSIRPVSVGITEEGVKTVLEADGTAEVSISP